ncbi:MAG: hypothetical protein ABGY96_14785 [bacterium]|nr:hypothetical protein [Gammaproteobacteria bacterium]HIL97322.1 hypothetical protein [Pseudomonadales bacterium]
MFEFIGFIVGIQLTMMLLAALYGILDLWYRIQDFWFAVIGRILLISGAIVLVYSATGEGFQSGFFVGQVFFVIFHIAIFWLGRLQIAYMRRQR